MTRSLSSVVPFRLLLRVFQRDARYGMHGEKLGTLQGFLADLEATGAGDEMVGVTFDAVAGDNRQVGRVFVKRGL